MEHDYIIDPSGCIVWDPTPDDYALVREEERDIISEVTGG